MGGGIIVVMREIDAPIRVFGKHWGAFRTAYKI
jgi:methyl-accepting chemotaxis protein